MKKIRSKLKGFPIIVIIAISAITLLFNTGLVSTVIREFKESNIGYKELKDTVINANRQEKNLEINTEKDERTLEEKLIELRETIEAETKGLKEDISAIGEQIEKEAQSNLDKFNIPETADADFVIVNNNIPYFTKEDLSKTINDNKISSFIELNELDELGRTQSAMMCAGPETLADEERESIGSIKPSGWVQARYDDLIKDKYLWNRCHLLAHNLSELNAEPKNLITGTRQMNAGSMLDFELDVADYIEETNNHVLYRVTPIYEGDELVARGVLMEAMSIEEKGLEFCVYVYNVQDGIEIDYKTGKSWRAE